ncbi:hypothetical protein BT96DRAFT_919567, partial [Gymnopus androsaceus JB14]
MESDLDGVVVEKGERGGVEGSSTDCFGCIIIDPLLGVCCQCCQCSSRCILLALINTIDNTHRIQHIHKVGPFTPGNNCARNSLNLCIKQIFVLPCKDALKGFPLWLYLLLTAGENSTESITRSLPRAPKPAAPNE